MIFLSRRLRAQPVSTRLVLANELAAYSPLVASPYLGPLVDPASGMPLTTLHSDKNFYRGSTDQGVAYRFPGTDSDNAIWPTSVAGKGWAGTTFEWTVFAIVRSASGAGASQGYVVSQDSLSLTPISLSITNSAGGVTAGAAVYDGSWHSSGTQATSIAGDAKWHVVAGSYRASSYLQYWLDGKLDTQNTTSIPASVSNSGNAPGIGVRLTDTAQFNGDILLVVAVRKACDASFIREATKSMRDAWGMLFKPKPSISYFGAAEAGAPPGSSAAYRWFLQQ